MQVVCDVRLLLLAAGLKARAITLGRLLASVLQAADIVHVVGIGRNEYIATMNKCKAKKLLWRVNKSIAKEFLPTEPLALEVQPWWQVGVVNLGEQPSAWFPPACELQLWPGLPGNLLCPAQYLSFALAPA